MKKILLKIFKISAGLYITICGLLFFFQEKLTFFPQRLERNYKSSFDQKFEEINITTKDNKLLNGILFKSDSSKGLIFYLHGNAGSLSSWGEVSKTYIVTIDSPFNSADYAPLKNGIALDDGEVMVDSVLCLNQSKTRLKVCLHSGKNRVIRRIFARLGYNVLKLDRVSFAQIVKKDLPVGRWRYLTDKEIERLKGIGLNKAVDE